MMNLLGRTRQMSSSLAPPTVEYANNHLLVVTKPAGWHSIPLDYSVRKGFTGNRVSDKCLLSWLKQRRVGGGSHGDFLLPLHRLDQPCSGLLLMAKTSKAASRITKVWKTHQVEKEYTCVLSCKDQLDSLQRASTFVIDKDGGKWYELKGIMRRSRSNKLGSVTMMPFMDSMDGKESDEISRRRVCSMKWRAIMTVNSYPMIVAITNDGARHMVRSMLAQVGHAPISGDIRYGATTPLLDKSVALHASRVTLPRSLVLPLEKYEFLSPIPSEWDSWFR